MDEFTASHAMVRTPEGIMSFREYRDLVWAALEDGELEVQVPAAKVGGGTWRFTNVISMVKFNKQMYRRKPKPRRIKGYIAVDPDEPSHGIRFSSLLYPTEQEARNAIGTKDHFIIIPIDYAAPEHD